jgi:4-hydroxy-tetrahydrodipicolinate reductase
MTRIVIIGAAGRMGKALVQGIVSGSIPDLELGGAVDLSTDPGQGQDIGLLSGTEAVGVNLSANLPALSDAGDVFIDFSFHSGIGERGELIAGWGKAWVIGTTGLTETERQAVGQIATRTPVMSSPNMSLGVNLLHALVKRGAEALRGKGYDIEIIERHHRKKLDAPSGTALYLGEAAAAGYQLDLDKVAKHGREGIADGERPEDEIGFHAVRGGDIAGDHTVLFAAEGESIELSHRATSRDTFAIGALRAAAWVNGKAPGLYSMNDVLSL